MYTLYRILRSLIRSIAAAAAPWQIAIGTLLGTLLGFVPIWPWSHAPSPLGMVLVMAAVIINCHVGSVLLFFGIGKLLARLLQGPEVMIGDHCSDVAQRSADVPLLYCSGWSTTGYLGQTILGLCLAPLCAILMLWLTHVVRTHLIERLRARRHLMRVGAVANHAWMVRIACWFFGL